MESIKKKLNSTVNLFFFLLKNLYSNFTFFKTVLLETDDEFSRDAVVVLEIKKNKLLMNVLKIMPLSDHFSLFL